MHKKYELPQFTDSGYKLFQEILVTLGKKTKKLFIDALKKEASEIISDTHAYMTAADVDRVAKEQKLYGAKV